MRHHCVVVFIALCTMGYASSCSIDEVPLTSGLDSRDSAVASDGSGIVDASTQDADVSPTDAAIECGHRLEMILRDFREEHPDFQDYIDPVRGIVEDTLGVDGIPVYAHEGKTDATTGPEEFNQWYRDVEGVNLTFMMPIELMKASGSNYEFRDDTFFPLDGRGYTIEKGDEHNYLFTTETHGVFEYRGGEHLRVSGDDDIWVFVNRKLVIDLGGVHPTESARIDLDASASALGITPGGRYPLDIFHAERYAKGSVFRVETSIACFAN